MAKKKLSESSENKWNWDAPNLVVTEETEQFNSSFGDLEATYKQAEFPSYDTAVAFFGSVEELLDAAADSVNSTLQNNAKSNVRNFEVRVYRMADSNIEILEKKMGRSLTEAELAKVRAKAREKITELDRLTKSLISIDDI